MDELDPISKGFSSSSAEFVEDLGGTSGDKKRTRSRIRIFNEASAEVIRKRIGGLQGFKDSLQLTTRRTCELLLIDPSTWSRWKANEDLVPPHSWRAMEWYLALQDKIPGLSAQYFLMKESGVTQTSIEKMIREGLRKEQAELEKLTLEATLKLEKMAHQIAQSNEALLNRHIPEERKTEPKPQPWFQQFTNGSTLLAFLLGSLISLLFTLVFN